jgi:L-seryl-tRNA(Ser) seleniumtransferase
MNPAPQNLLRQLPGVNELLLHFQSHASDLDLPRKLMIRVIRQTLAKFRADILASEPAHLPVSLNLEDLLDQIQQGFIQAQRPRLLRVINATGVIIHTNLGRSPLAAAALQRIQEVAGNYCNLEFDLSAGKRGSRHDHLEGLLQELTSAEAALILNNNAAAVLLTLNTLALGREVIVSRGQLVEIGGSFRMPDVMAASGALLREVGTTNKTHLRDYEAAITSETGMLLKVHTSNFRLIGFTQEVSLADLAALGHREGLPVVEDLGSGCLIDLSRYGLPKEPSVAEALEAGADLVLFSGDKLLGGPQAGIALGSKALIDRLKKNPLTRALRPDKLTLVGLEATLRLYRDEQMAVRQIPTLWMLTRPLPEVEIQARHLARSLRRRLSGQLQVQICPSIARVGGGALPQTDIPSRALCIETPAFSPHRLEEKLRHSFPPIIARLEQHRLLLDVRTLFPVDHPLVVKALEEILADR